MGSAIFLYIFGLVFIIGYVALLPLIQGVAKIKRNHKSSRRDEDESVATSSSSMATSGYVPPSDQYLDSKLTKKSRKLKLQDIHKEDMPINYVPDFERETKKKIERINLETLKEIRNPDNYDYDLDELIKEENDEDERERLRILQNQMNEENRQVV